MTHPPAPTETGAPRGSYVVRAPRASDAVGGSLRNIYSADLRLPSDLVSLLDRLDVSSH